MEGGPYVPPASVQYAIRAIRASQVGTAAAYFFGEQAAEIVGMRPPSILRQMHANKLAAAGVVYAMHVVAQTFQSINAFEVTYNGHVLHSKLKSGAFPDVQQLVTQLHALKVQEESNKADTSSKSNEEDA